MRALILPALVLLAACGKSGDRYNSANEGSGGGGGDGGDGGGGDGGDGGADADGDGWTVDGGDCDDTDDQINPDAAEICDDLDNDCDGQLDEDATDAFEVYLDEDGDGYGNNSYPADKCEVTDGWAAVGDDCDDSDISVNPGAQEICDIENRDEDCDGLRGDADDSLDTDGLEWWYADTDGDGYGDPDNAVQLCEGGEGWIADDTDCDDTDAFSTPENECEPGWSGEYSGSFDYTATAFSITDTCSGSVSLLVYSDRSPAVNDTISCTWATLTTTESVTVVGELVDDTLEVDIVVGSTTLEPTVLQLTEPDSLGGDSSGLADLWGTDVVYDLSVDLQR